MASVDNYESPLVRRYAGREMCELFGERTRILTWRSVWISLAKAEHRAGLPVTSQQIAELERTRETIDFESAARHENKLRHDVMAHVHAWGEIAPNARAIIHLGATSAEVVDNADLIIMRDALRLVAASLAAAIDALGGFAETYKSLPTLGYTHLQPAQVTTVGKRAAMWCYDFVRDLQAVERLAAELRLRGVKGATGTQASFVALCGGDERKVLEIERDFATQLGFDAVEPVTGQTYSRKVDAEACAMLAQVATSVHKFANDLRLLQNFKEMEEPFEAEQIGSSAMAYKRNPMRCERATALARFVIAQTQSVFQTAAEQWLERTLDDSANKRLTIPESFLATDAMLRIVLNVARGLVVNEKVIESRLRAELPFMATEEILMAGAQAGVDRQDLHERIRQHSQAAAEAVKVHGRENDLIERLRGDSAFARVNLSDLMNPSRFVGRAPQQVEEFLRGHIAPIQKRYAGRKQPSDLKV
ncbi:MAG: adenylosuccinate lyase [Planctomycetes bacterium]|nr:adenylosuccinate lyase [Planctomycetota bacterium]MBI3833025.1 adenylosuccinate lyase [Planctomycetota bacterium]